MLTAGDEEIIENGPLRARVLAQVAFDDGTARADYAIEYTLVAGEPFVRVAVTGSAPLSPGPNLASIPYSVMVRFPLTLSNGPAADKVTSVVRGTPYHVGV
jgi:hypothetical protein